MRTGDSTLVIGGGLAGGAAAAALAASGRRVVLVEREAGPHDKVCGEFLAPRAQAALGALGIDLDALGAVPIETVRLARGDRIVEVRLPFRGASLSRRILDEALLALAASNGAEIRRGRRVVALEAGPAGFRARLEAGEALSAGTVLLATGKHDLRGWRRPAGLQTDLVGFKQHLTLAPPAARVLEGAVELILFDGGYAGLQPAEAGRATLCLVIRRRRLAQLGGSWPGVLAALRAEAPALTARLEGAVAGEARPVAVAAIPYGAVRWRAHGVWHLGDQAAVVPSFAGDGMAIALQSAALAVALLQAGASPEAYQRRLALAAGPRVMAATLLSQALVRPAGQGVLAGLARCFPGLVRRTASATRLELA